MNVPTALNSRKLVATGIGVAAITILGVTGHDAGPAVAGIVTLAGGGALAQGVLDFKGAGSAPEQPAVKE